MKKTAFTLIELLVVISIIAILAGIALPVYSSAMAKSKQISDLSNLKNIGIAFSVNLNDNSQQVFPTTNNAFQLYDGKVAYTLYATMADTKIWKSRWDPRNPTGKPEESPVSYSFNEKIWVTTPDWNGNWEKLANPSSFYLASLNYDGDPGDSKAWVKSGTATSIPLLKAGGGAKTKGPVGSKVSWLPVLFGDMHCEPVMMTDFKKDPNSDARGKIFWQPYPPVPSPP